jgi:hypothetical protein
MAQTLWEKCDNDSYVIYNQGAQRYSTATWERLKANYGLTDEQLAKTLNNK